MEIPMKSVNLICISVLLVGAAAVISPTFAADNDQPSVSASDQAPADATQTANADTQANTQANTPAAAADNSQAGSQMAMNASSDSNSMGKTSKKYSRKSRARDFRAEQSITKQLNQQASAEAKPNQQTASAE
jgi:hypothetical protein